MSVFDKLFHSDDKDKKKENTPDKVEGKEGEETPNPEEHPHKHSKWHDALQQWSNDNERDIEEDDADPLKSGL